MKSLARRSRSCFAFGFASILAASSCLATDDWPGWRGPAGDGVARSDSVAPLDCPSERLAWRTPVAGEGHASPIVSGDRVFLVSAEIDTGERMLLAFDRSHGEELWRRTIATAPREKMHAKNTSASSTPATDGAVVITSFAADGEFLVCAHRLDGELAWRRSLGPFVSRHGLHSCPVLHEDSALIAGLQDSAASFVARLDTQTGETLWSSSPGSVIRSFSPPHVVELGDRKLVVVSGANQTVAFDWETGERLWIVEGPAEKTVSSIVEAEGRLFVCGGRDSALLAITPSRDAGRIEWRGTQGVPYVPSPLAYDGALHLISDEGVYTRLSLESGDRLGRRRLLQATSASPVLVGSKMLAFSESGRGVLVDLANNAKVLAKPEFDEGVFASPAVTSREVFVRTTDHLFCYRATETP